MTTNATYVGQIHRIVATLSPRLTPEDVAEGVVREAMAALDARAGAVGFFDAGHARLIFSVGYPEAILEGWTAGPVELFPVLHAVSRGEAAFVRARDEDTRFDVRLGQIYGRRGGSFVVPLAAGGRVFGFFGMSWDHVHEFDEHEREFILTLAGHCAQSLERARLFAAEREARAAADATRRELEAVLCQLPVAVSIVGVDGRVVANDEVRRIYRVPQLRETRMENVDYPASKMKRLDGREYTASEVPIVRAMRGETVSGEEMIITRGDGSECPVRVNAGPIRGDDGITAAVGVFEDISGEQHVARELRAAERRYRAVLRATRDIIWEFDPIANRLEWNGALEYVFGYSSAETNQHPGGGFGWWVDHVHPEDRSRAVGSFESAVAKGDELYVSEYRFQRKDGGFVPTLDRCVFERNGDGEVYRVIGAMSDVSEQHRLLSELREAVRVRDDFLSIASHELRTPLAALAAQLLGIRTLPLDAAHKEQKLAAADRQLRRMDKLVDELLDVSRIVHGTLRLQLDDVDLAAVASDAAARLADDYARAGTPLTVDAPAPVLGRWDRLRIDIVITNLLTNALRYGERNPVRLSVDTVGACGRVTVADQGIGIRAEDHERIFERFVRVAPSRQFGGLGVGLWLARQIVEAHGGALMVRSDSGVGSQFILELPMGPSSAAGGAERSGMIGTP